jgi:16S rRNA (uracil1498-N3)-methyltransferase
VQRYFILPEQKDQERITITGQDVHHIKNVMRFRAGDQVICCDGRGLDYLVEITEITKEKVVCLIRETFPSRGEPRTKVTIAQSLPRGDKIDWILQKGTELGAYRFLPFLSERSLVKLDQGKAQKKQERWQKIVKEAAEQSHRGRVPEVELPIAWNELLQRISEAEISWIAYENGGESLKSAIQSAEVDEILLIIGPEGGFSEREIAEAKAHGAIPVSLGNRILRTETAPLMALSCILFAKEDLGGETE